MKITHDLTNPRERKSTKALLGITRCTCVAIAALGGIAFASTHDEAKAPRPLPDMRGVHTQAAPVTKDPSDHVAPRAAIVSTPADELAHDAQLASAAGARRRVSAIDHSRMYFKESQHDSLWARGASYKSEFRAERATYVPFFGSRAPVNHPISFQVERMSVGGNAILFATEAPVARDGERISMQRGAFVEQYDLTPNAMEQRFVFDSLPSGGDLEVRVGFHTDLAPSATEGGIRFTNELGSVHYSSAVAIDANGASVPATTTLDGDSIVITVPASFLAHAALPLTIDPQITTFAIDQTSPDVSQPDAAYDSSTARFGVVYTEFFSLFDADPIACEIGFLGELVPNTAQYLDISDVSWTNMKIANNTLAHQFLVVGTYADLNVGYSTIIGFEIPAFTFVPDGALGITTDFNANYWECDVGGDPSVNGPTYYCVTWRKVALAGGESDIEARLVTTNLTLVGAGPIEIDNSANTLDEYPAISKCDGYAPASSQAWTIVWQREYSPTDHDIYYAQVAWDGIVTVPSFTLDISTNDDTMPKVSSPTDPNIGGGRRNMIVYQRQCSPTDRDIRGVLFTGNFVLDQADLNTMDAVNALTKDQFRPSVDTDGEQFAVAYSQYASDQDADVYLSSFNGAGDHIGLSEPRHFVAGNPTVEMDVSITALHSGQYPGARYFLAWDATDVSGGTYASTIDGATYDGPTGGPVTEFCGQSNFSCPCGNGGATGYGCANSQIAFGAHLGATGNASLVNDSLVLHGTFMTSSSTCIYLQGSDYANALFGDGVRCAGGTLLRLATKQNSQGASNYPVGNDAKVSVKGLVPAIGGTRIYQTYYRDPASFCTPFTYNITNAVAVTWVP
jgi:hypothetical protein